MQRKFQTHSMRVEVGGCKNHPNSSIHFYQKSKLCVHTQGWQSTFIKPMCMCSAQKTLWLCTNVHRIATVVVVVVVIIYHASGSSAYTSKKPKPVQFFRKLLWQISIDFHSLSLVFEEFQIFSLNILQSILIMDTHKRNMAAKNRREFDSFSIHSTMCACVFFEGISRLYSLSSLSVWLFFLSHFLFFFGVEIKLLHTHHGTKWTQRNEYLYSFALLLLCVLLVMCLC